MRRSFYFSPVIMDRVRGAEKNEAAVFTVEHDIYTRSGQPHKKPTYRKGQRVTVDRKGFVFNSKGRRVARVFGFSYMASEFFRKDPVFRLHHMSDFSLSFSRYKKVVS